MEGPGMLGERYMFHEESHAGHSRHAYSGSASKQVAQGRHSDDEFIAYARKTFAPVRIECLAGLADECFEIAS